MAVERRYLRDGGLPERPFYRNELYSPGRLWDTVPFPAVGDAILDGRWNEAVGQIPLAAETLGHIATAIDAATVKIARAAHLQR
jgi:N-acetylated-alpha-linked acidic dipeptidase